MSTSYVPDEINQAVNTFLSQNPSRDIQALKQFAHQNFPDPDEQQRFLKAVFDRAVKKAELASAVNRIWPERKGY